MPEPDPLADLRSTIHTFATVLAGVAPEQQTLATPCSDWSVSDLIDHVIDGNAYFADVVAGRTARDEPPGPGQGERFDWSAHALLDALSTNAASTGTHRVPAGELPGSLLVIIRTVEHLAHAWDLAAATGQRVAADDEPLIRRAVAATTELLARLPDGHQPFAPPVPVSDNAAPLERMLALLGRDPTWGSHPANDAPQRPTN